MCDVYDLARYKSSLSSCSIDVKLEPFVKTFTYTCITQSRWCICVYVTQYVRSMPFKIIKSSWNNGELFHIILWGELLKRTTSTNLWFLCENLIKFMLYDYFNFVRFGKRFRKWISEKLFNDTCLDSEPCRDDLGLSCINETCSCTQLTEEFWDTNTPDRNASCQPSKLVNNKVQKKLLQV